MTSEQIPEGDERLDHVEIRVKHIPVRKNSLCKGPGAGVSGMNKEQQGCFVVGEERAGMKVVEDKARMVMGGRRWQIMEGVCKDLGVTVGEMGEPLQHFEKKSGKPDFTRITGITVLKINWVGRRVKGRETS